MLTPLQEEIPTLLTIYEHHGHFDKVLSLLEAGLSLERAHVCINGQVFSCHSHLSSRWASSSSWQFCIANTDPANVSCHSCHSLIFLTALFSNGTPQVLRRPHQYSKGRLYLILL